MVRKNLRKSSKDIIIMLSLSQSLSLPFKISISDFNNPKLGIQGAGDADRTEIADDAEGADIDGADVDSAGIDGEGVAVDAWP